ncbi:uncharacterized protein LOC127130418 [Lathyrus oleraceus]|uniref:uncharacterized protein LOC127130418 n=1 Tax=Pisum sativum TaxID=3888 RepID=UPI0021D04338|nr:uncharacterized protein LOC127130418 [Pisum sativum]
MEEIRESQKSYLGLIDRLALINQGKEVDFKIDENGVMRFRGKVCVPDFPELKKKILEEGHRSGLNIHPSATNMYQDLKKMFWCSSVKKDVVEFAHFLPIKINYQLQKLVEVYIKEIVKLHGIPSSIVADRDLRFTSSIRMELYQALYGMKCQTLLCWYESGESAVLGSEIS